MSVVILAMTAVASFFSLRSLTCLWRRYRLKTIFFERARHQIKFEKIHFHCAVGFLSAFWGSPHVTLQGIGRWCFLNYLKQVTARV